MGVQVEALVHDHDFTDFSDFPSPSVTSPETSEFMQESPFNEDPLWRTRKQTRSTLRQEAIDQEMGGFPFPQFRSRSNSLGKFGGRSPSPRRWDLQPSSNQVTPQGSDLCICLLLVGSVFEDVQWQASSPRNLGPACWVFASLVCGGSRPHAVFPFAGEPIIGLPRRQTKLTCPQCAELCSWGGGERSEMFVSEIESSPCSPSCSALVLLLQGSVPGREVICPPVW